MTCDMESLMVGFEARLFVEWEDGKEGKGREFQKEVSDGGDAGQAYGLEWCGNFLYWTENVVWRDAWDLLCCEEASRILLEIWGKILGLYARDTGFWSSICLINLGVVDVA